MIVNHKLGSDFMASVEYALDWCRDICRYMEVKEIRLHPLDQYLDEAKWPHRWPPLVLDEKTTRHTVEFRLVEPNRAEQLALL